IAILSLLYAGIEDIIFREVRREFIWLLMIGAGIVLDILYLVLYDGSRAKTDILAEMLLTIVIGFVLGFVLFYIGAWGGADSKALWSLAILTPLHPFRETTGTLLNFDFELIWAIDSSIISILLNSGLLAVCYPIVLMIINSIKATKGSLFEEVRGTTSEKLRCFCFGYKKKIDKINPKKLHYDFLEVLPDRKFRGLFDGEFKGRLDGTFIGVFQGTITGEFNGTMYGKVLDKLEKPLEDCDIDDLIKEAETVAKLIKIEKNDAEDEIDFAHQKYLEMFSNTTENSSDVKSEQIINFSGKINVPITLIFIGIIEGVFDGNLKGKMSGDLTGHYVGESPKGKLSGTSTQEPETWKIKVRLGLDEETMMEKRQLRTLWLLQTTKKKTVWVTPGLPFVFLMLIGYILYILFGNIFLFLFRI
ncbi:MAG: A24 family peptidase C-terminal domain-containing protein, partial [Candidatus Heimdallarchaeota archaeon]